MLKQALKIISFVFVMLIVTILVTVGEILIDPHIAGLPFRTIPAPTGGEYKVVLYGYPFPAAAMPGQGSDRGGLARVYSTNGTLLCQIDAPMIGQLDEHSVRWNGDSVSILGYEGFESCRLR